MLKPDEDLAFTAELLSLPSFDNIAEQYGEIPVDGILDALTSLHRQIANELSAELHLCYQNLQSEPYRYEQQQIGVRALRNLCLQYLCYLPDAPLDLLRHQFAHADNMTDVIATLYALVRANQQLSTEFLAQFLAKYQDNVQLFDKHSNLSVSLQDERVYAAVSAIETHSSFSWQNPNRVRAVYSAFASAKPKDVSPTRRAWLSVSGKCGSQSRQH